VEETEGTTPYPKKQIKELTKTKTCG